MAAIIFDFDGTIADSFDYVAGFLARQAGIEKLSATQKNMLKNLSMVGMARRLGFGWWRLPWLFFKGRREMRKTAHLLNSFQGIPNLIKKLHAEGHELFVLSSNIRHNINSFLKSQELSSYFVETYGGIGLFSKTPALRRLLREQNIEIKDAIYIGDELRDIEAASAMNLRIVAVSWGFASRKNLEASKPTVLVDSVDELMRVLEEI